MRGWKPAIGTMSALAVMVSGSGPAAGHEERKESIELVNLVGTATRLPHGAIRLVRAGRAGAVGAAYTAERLPVGSGFDVRFTLSMSVPTGNCLADGMTFVIQDQGPFAVGASGGYLGYGREYPRVRGGDGISRSLVVELDVWSNSARDFGRHGRPDPRVAHVSVQTRGDKQNDANPRYSLASAPAPTLSDGAIHTVRVHYVRHHRLDVFLDGDLLLRHRLDVASMLGLADARAYLGFTASTGACTEDADLHAVTIRGLAIHGP